MARKTTRRKVLQHYKIIANMKRRDSILIKAMAGGVLVATAYAGTVTWSDQFLFTGTDGTIPAVMSTGNGGVVFGGAYNNGSLAVSGTGARMIWYPTRAAFAVGRWTNSAWTTNMMGVYSVAMGYEAVASENGTLAMGVRATASGTRSLAMGQMATASGPNSIALGPSAVATGDSSVAIGSVSASGTSSTALGRSTLAAGSYSLAGGLGTTASAYGSMAIGRYNQVGGSSNTWTGTDPVFVIGNGTNASSLRNALTVYQNGNMTVTGTITMPMQGDIQMGEFGSTNTP